MGFFFRRSIKCGPIWVNFSKSEIGVSVGGRGFRTGISSTGRRTTPAVFLIDMYRRTVNGAGTSEWPLRADGHTPRGGHQPACLSRRPMSKKSPEFVGAHLVAYRTTALRRRTLCTRLNPLFQAA